jgi:ketosteroid isomerase-like protein
MSQENVDTVLELVQPGPDVDFVPLFCQDEIWAVLAATVGPLFHDDCEIVTVGVPGYEGTHVGMEGMRATWLEWLAPWESYRATVEEAVDLGDRVLLLYRTFGRLGPGAPEVPAEFASVWTFRDGKIARVEFHATSRAEARKAFGLEA